MSKKVKTNYNDLIEGLGEEEDVFVDKPIPAKEQVSEPKIEKEIQKEEVKPSEVQVFSRVIVKEEPTLSGPGVDEVKLDVKKEAIVTPEVPKVETLKGIETATGESDELPGEDLKLKRSAVEFKKGDFHSLLQLEDLILGAITNNEASKAANIYMTEQTQMRMEKIQKALKAQPNINTKAKLPLVQKIVVDFFWQHFKDDVLKRVEKAEKDATKRLM